MTAITSPRPPPPKPTISPLIYFCAIAFGASSWLHVNGIWVELPLLVNELPEGMYCFQRDMTAIIASPRPPPPKPTISPLIYFCAIAFGASSWLHVNGIWVELPLLVNELPEGMYCFQRDMTAIIASPRPPPPKPTISPLIYFCAIAFGASSWLHVNGIWVELPLLVNELPEGMYCFQRDMTAIIASPRPPPPKPTISPLIYFCAIAFGASSWLHVNGIWVELPLLVNELPEGMYCFQRDMTAIIASPRPPPPKPTISPLIYFCAIAFGASSWLHVNGIWVELPLLVNELPEGMYCFQRDMTAIIASPRPPPPKPTISPLIYFCAIAFGASSWLHVNGIWVELPLLVNELPEGMYCFQRDMTAIIASPRPPPPKPTISPLIYFCAIAFGASSWLHVNGIWVELPLLVNELPEGWNLPSFLAMIVQLAIVGPLLYALIERVKPSIAGHDQLGLLIAGMFVFGSIATVLLAVFWHQTSWLAGAERSTALFALVFCVSLIDTTSNVTFLPYMGVLQSPYIVAYFIGMGVSALVPSVTALIQGAGHTFCVPDNSTRNHSTLNELNSPGGSNFQALGNDTWDNFEEFSTPAGGRQHYVPQSTPARFSVEVFFISLFVSFVISGLSFCYLNWSRLGHSQRVVTPSAFAAQSSLSREPETGPLTPEPTGPHRSPLRTQNHSTPNGEPPAPFDNPADPMTSKQSPVSDYESTKSTMKTSNNEPKNELHSGEQQQQHQQHHPEQPLSTFLYIFLLVLTGWVCALMNGILPSIQSFSCLPYGQTVYHVAATLSNIANPIACFVPFFIQVHSPSFIIALTSLASAIAAYTVAMAALSPSPLLIGTIAGKIVVVVSWILAIGLCAYLRTVMAEMLRSRAGPHRPRSLFWCGAATQAGSFLGALLMFPLVNVYKLFVSGDPCSEYNLA